MRFSGCGKEIEFESVAHHLKLVENSKYGLIDMDFDLLDGKDTRAFQTKAGTTYNFKYDIDLKKGDLRVIFTDSNDNIIEDIGWIGDKGIIDPENEDQLKIGGEKKIKSVDDKVKVVIEGENAQGSVMISW